MQRHDLSLAFVFLPSVIGLLSGCFEPDLGKITVLCPPESPTCPSGYTCVSGVCRAATDQGVVDQGTGGPGDMTTILLCPKGGDVPIG